MRAIAASVVFLAASAASTALAVDVCGYLVSAPIGGPCPVRAGSTVCASTSALTGPCDRALRCFSDRGFFCSVTLTPSSGPQPQCPLQSRRLTGFRCAPIVNLVRHTPTATPEEVTATPTATETPPLGTPTGTATASLTPTESGETATPTETEDIPVATETATVGPTGTPTGSTAAEIPPAAARKLAIPRWRLGQ